MGDNRIIFFDDAAEGPFWDVWKLFGGKVIL
jgi:hypothetical protein